MTFGRILFLAAPLCVLPISAAAQMGSDAGSQAHVLSAALVLPVQPAASGAAVPDRTTARPEVVASQPVETAKRHKHHKRTLAPVAVVEPQPVLDYDGSQLLDPDGKPIFTARLVQKRAKNGAPVFLDGQPVYRTAEDPGYDDNGKKIAAVKVRTAKLMPLSLGGATFYFDSFVARMELASDTDANNLFFYVPRIGVVTVAREPFAGATEQAAAFSGDSLSVHVAGHTVRIKADKQLVKKPESAFVRVDRSFNLAVQHPVFGFGSSHSRPYQWPYGTGGSQLATLR